MELEEQLKRQRVKHIVSSYQLDGDDKEAFHRYLETLFITYPPPLIELALVETLVNHWLKVPMTKGCAFLAQAHEQLVDWSDCTIATTIAPEQFQQITGLDPSPIFGASAASIRQFVP